MSALFWESETLEFWGGGRCAPGFKNHSEVVRGSLKVVIGYQKIGVVNNPGSNTSRNPAFITANNVELLFRARLFFFKHFLDAFC